MSFAIGLFVSCHTPKCGTIVLAQTASAPTDPFTVVNALLTFVTVVAAAISLKYARDAARAARDSVEPLDQMATGIQVSIRSLGKLTHEIQETRSLGQLANVVVAVQHLGTAIELVRRGARPELIAEAQSTLQAALAPLAAEALDDCRRLGVAPDAAENPSLLQKAISEIAGAIRQEHAKKYEQA